ncbi:MAG: glycosyltransferase family 2 protein [Pseudomonadota bacterium]
MGGGFGHRDWNATLPQIGGIWPERNEFDELSARALREQLQVLRDVGRLLDDDVVLISVVRNEALRLPAFFEHYKRLGVKRFFMLDNTSEDSTLDLLLAEPTATVFHTAASYRDSCCGIYWINGIARAYCAGHWTVLADADELLVYDGQDQHDLLDLGRWLFRNGQERLFAPMIDIYPPGVIGETGLSVIDNIQRNSWFDTSGYALQQHRGGWLLTGGPRQRLFGRRPLVGGEWASKYPFFLMKPEISIFNAHFIWPRDAEPARPFGALIHLKFMDDFAERAARNEREGQHYDDARKYRIINETLSEQPKQIAHYRRSAEYTGPECLVRHQLMLPIDWKVAGQTLPHFRTFGDIDYRDWGGLGRHTSLSAGEREEFEDFSRRSFSAHMTTIRSRGRLAPDEIGLVCVLRNEAARLPLFFDHYKRLGVRRFLMIDNNSEDGSLDVLAAEPMADIFHAHALFSEGQGGLFWAQTVARRYGEGNWLMRPDADELFVFDGMEEHDLHELARWLERHEMDRIYAPMIDLYPSVALGSSSQTVEQLIDTDSWFDNDGYSLERWPQGWRLTGGPRYRVFYHQDKHRNLMWKYPFFRMGPDTLFFNHHWLWPFDTSTRGALGAMVHLKLMHDFIERSERYEREGQHWNNSVAYKSINSKVRDLPEVVMFHEDSKRYRGPRSLIRHGMMQPIEWDA